MELEVTVFQKIQRCLSIHLTQLKAKYYKQPWILMKTIENIDRNLAEQVKIPAI